MKPPFLIRGRPLIIWGGLVQIEKKIRSEVRRKKNNEQRVPPPPRPPDDYRPLTSCPHDTILGYRCGWVATLCIHPPVEISFIGDVEVSINHSFPHVVPVKNINPERVLFLSGQVVNILQPKPEVITSSSKPILILVPVTL